MEGMIVLVAFSLAFAAIALWAYLPRNKQRIEAYRDIPFQGERHGG